MQNKIIMIIIYLSKYKNINEIFDYVILIINEMKICIRYYLK
jgi:hypothetical protein